MYVYTRVIEIMLPQFGSARIRRIGWLARGRLIHRHVHLSEPLRLSNLHTHSYSSEWVRLRCFRMVVTTPSEFFQHLHSLNINYIINAVHFETRAVTNLPTQFAAYMRCMRLLRERPEGWITCDGGSIGRTSDSTTRKKYQQSFAALCFVGLRFWERDVGRSGERSRRGETGRWPRSWKY
jgi:hypothetical protein